MRFGISVPNFGEFGDVHLLRDLAAEAEDQGWDGFFLWDHINWYALPMVDPWIALAVIASATRRIRIGTMVTPLPRRRPWKLARETVTLDHLSGGRVVLGVGLGHPPDREFAAFGEVADDRERAVRLDEGLDVLLALWGGEEVRYQGKQLRVDGAQFLPRPVQQPRIPVWVAGVWPARAPFRRAARFDGSFPMKVDGRGAPQPIGPGDVREMRAYVESHREARGPFDFVVAGPLPRDLEPYQRAGVTWWIEGGESPADLRAVLRRRPG